MMNSAVDLFSIPLSQVRGIGKSKALDLSSLGIFSVGHLLEYFPSRYEDFRIRELDEAIDGEKLTIQAVFMSPPVIQRYARKMTRMSCKAASGDSLFTAVWFNQAYLQERIAFGVEVILTGKWDRSRRQLTVTTCEFPTLNRSQLSRAGTIQAVYSIGGSLTQSFFRKMIHAALQQFKDSIGEFLPTSLVMKHQLITRQEAIENIHIPKASMEGTAARKRLVYEELFLFQLKIQAWRAWMKLRNEGVAHIFDREIVRQFARSLPYELTYSQKQVIAEVLNDMESPHSMNRLLQGDVGSGKTAVAAVALFACVKGGRQGAMMVPTEILAEQHLRSLQRMYQSQGIEVAMLTGSLGERQRRDLLAGLQSGLIDIVVGTHALIQEDVYFRNLGLVVTDEQHRFGVQQRSFLRRKGIYPDVLTMTATPIPRTLSMTAFGDMDVSTLRELPKGRLPVRTSWVKHQAMDQVLALIRREMTANRQAYVICPLIEESDKLDYENALDMYVRLQAVFGNHRVGLLHGKLTNAEKEAVMEQFSNNRMSILVSTTVVEVGVDVPNASVMVIYDAERFGLSQLHQLRGRVGRSAIQSYCVLIADPKSELGKERMRVMTETNDGFEVARRDMELRGPGDFFGTKQSGVPEFRLADLFIDYALLEAARDDAAELLRDPLFWSKMEYTELVAFIMKDGLFRGELID